MMMKKYNLYIILLICTLSSCSDFLEESSQDLMIPRSVKDYKELFFGEVMKTNEKDIPHPYLEYMTDDVKDQCYYGTRPQVISNDFREEIGEIGRRAEHAMLEATCGVNTHKGAIWSLGLVISACASLRMNADSNQILDCAGGIARITDRFVPYELTHGLKVKAKYRCHGAKEEAQLGFPHVRHLGLPMLRKSKQRGDGITVSRLNSLLAILSSLEDTCVLHRGGLTALRETQRRSTAVLLAGGVGSVKGEELLEDFGCWMKDSSLSPGGAADLLATSLFIQRLSNIQ